MMNNRRHQRHQQHHHPIPKTMEDMIKNSCNVLDVALTARRQHQSSNTNHANSISKQPSHGNDDNAMTTTTATATAASIHWQRPTLIERAIPSILFRECHGILILHVVEAAFVVSCNVGTGLLLKKQRTNNTGGGAALWSLPVAVGLSGIGWGMIGGAARKDVVVFIMDDDTLDAIMDARFVCNLSTQASFTIGDRGREVETSLHASLLSSSSSQHDHHGNDNDNTKTKNKQHGSLSPRIGATVAFSYSRGFLVGLSLEGSIVAPRSACNQAYYGRRLLQQQHQVDNHMVTPQDILHNALVDKVLPVSIQRLHAKLQELAATSSEPPTVCRDNTWCLVAAAPPLPPLTIQDDSDDDDDHSMVVIDGHIDDKHHPVSMVRVSDIDDDDDEIMEIVSREVETQTSKFLLVATTMAPPAKQPTTDDNSTYRQVAQTQTDEEITMMKDIDMEAVASKPRKVPLYREAQTQTGEKQDITQDAADDDGVILESEPTRQPNVHDDQFVVHHQVAQTQTDEQIAIVSTDSIHEKALLYQEAQTQTGAKDCSDDDDGAIPVSDPPVAKQPRTNDEQFVERRQVAQTQTDGDLVANGTTHEVKVKEVLSYQEVQTQTGEENVDTNHDDDDDAVVLVFKRNPVEPYQVAQSTQTDQLRLYQEAQTQTTTTPFEDGIVDAKSFVNPMTHRVACSATQTEDDNENSDAAIISDNDDEDYSAVDVDDISEDDEEMEFVMMTSDEIANEMNATGM